MYSFRPLPLMKGVQVDDLPPHSTYYYYAYEQDNQQRGRGRIRIQIRKIYSFRPLPLMKGCRWMTYHLTVHTIIMHVNKKPNKLTTMYLN